MALSKRQMSPFLSNRVVFNQADAELVATCDETTEVDAEYDRITRNLYVTEQRVFFLVESFFSFDGRLATSTKPVSSEQARAWCTACGLDGRVVDRYLAKVSKASALPIGASLLTQQWGINTPVDHTIV